MQGSRILFVDDNFIFNLDLREFLRSSGFNVEAAYCASAAFQAIDRRRHLSALVTDIDLGPGPDGFAVARHARAAYPHLPVVFISGTRASSHALEGVAGSEFLDKPFAFITLAQALARLIRLDAAEAPRPAGNPGERPQPSAS